MTNADAVQIETKLRAHGAVAKFIQRHSGAAVDLLEFQPAGDTRLAKVQALAPDLALAVGVESVRILAPIPGTTNIGIEVPAEKRTTVAYENVWSLPKDLHTHDKALPFPVGQQVGNGVIWADLATTPHLLIAGATGSGKSVALNTILTSLIDHVDADSLRLHLVDPKRVELGQFKDAPQVENFVTTVDDAVDLLDDLVDEMERRYEIFEADKVRNIAEWNEQFPGTRDDFYTMPYHVLVIDEMADLMSQRKDDVEPQIQRLTQLARAAGIHLILATQRPSVNVITGVIKANVPSRWCFTVASGVDSKVVLDTVGAEALYGQGDSLWAPYGALKPLRVQGVWTSDEEVERAINGACDRHVNDPAQAVTVCSLNQRAANEGDPLTLEDMGLGNQDVDLDPDISYVRVGAGTSEDVTYDDAQVSQSSDEGRQLAVVRREIRRQLEGRAPIGYAGIDAAIKHSDAEALAIPPGEPGHIPSPFPEHNYVDATSVLHHRPSVSPYHLSPPTPAEVGRRMLTELQRAEDPDKRAANFLAWGRLATIWAVVAGVVILVVTR